MESARILVAVSGGIAAYKVPELVRQLQRQGHDVRCVATPAALRFVSPLALQALTGETVRSALFDPSEEGEIDHIRLADWADLVIVAPATADLLAKMATGLADDLVTAVLLATRAQILVAPAMNVNMWTHSATQENLETLRSRGIQVIGPESGELACGWEGAGRMSDPVRIVAEADLSLGTDSLSGQTVLVTAGGTAEAIDAVRSITNRSSGKMGFAIAEQAARRGARVRLVAGVTALATPAGVERLDVESAREMREAVMAELPTSTIVIKAAAVADFTPENVESQKIKKEGLEDQSALMLRLVTTPDILREVCDNKGDRIVVGFAAESQNVVEAAREKIRRKGCDLLVANDISRDDAGFDVDTNAVLMVTPDGGVEETALLSKREIAGQVLDRVEKIMRERLG
ncbi:MAG: bifunctional phosphopantothenoylcysteine decarboxylase/phosphopantothenate--cysteine ligase CoaBC [Spirochaeta sp.]|nr:bifunctional phosphopantothenoylcysteine decarboxylase/phosphopantothenate--cysteine ligase CoaBC [Spirochaeta sp.]RPG13365.1 MAG: bifunctional phosphopantothenoylcysteine decarboxylase/phosphopantothenate--cysteine ligase CoaBC [Proteobacteria bacterium TMED72]